MEKQTLREYGKVAKVAFNSLSKKYIDRIFMRLTAIYGHKFTSLFPIPEAIDVAKAEWSSALAELSDFQINQALNRCRLLSEWNPSIPEFIRMSVNFPNLEVSIQRIKKNKITDLVTQKIALIIGSYDLKNKSEKQIERMVKGTYSDAYESALNEMIGRDYNWVPPDQLENSLNKLNKKEVQEKIRTFEIGKKSIKKIRHHLEKERES